MTRGSAFHPVLSVSLAIALCAPYALSQESKPNIFDLTIEELLQVKVTGVTLTEQSNLTAPAAINVFDKDGLRRLGVRKLSELFRFVPGFQNYRPEDGVAEAIASRGRLNGTAGREILVLLDGVRLENNLFGGMTASVNDLNLEFVERVEVIRGPVSQVYGANAFLAVINIISRSKADQFSIAAGNNLEFDTSLQISGKRGESTHLLQLHGYKDSGQDFIVQDPFSQQNIEVNDGVEGHQVQYRFGYRSLNLDITDIRSEAFGFFALGGFEKGFSGIDREFTSINLNSEHELNAKLDAKFTLGYRQSVTSLQTAITGEGQLSGVSFPPGDQPLRLIYTDEEDSSWFSASFNYRQNKSNSLTLAVDWRNDSLEDTPAQNNYSLTQFIEGDFPIDFYGDLDQTSPQIPPSDRERSSLFIQNIYTFRNQSQLTLGLRYDHYSDVDDSFSPRATWVLPFGDSQSIKVVYSEAFRAPTFSELYWVNSPIVISDTMLEPESIRAGEFVYQYVKGNQVFQANVFHNTIDDRIGQAIQPDGRRKFFNGDSAETQGLEFNWSRGLNKALKFRTNYSYLWKKQDNMFRLADSFGDIQFEYSQNNWQLMTDIQYIGSREFVSRETFQRIDLGAVYLWNLSGQYLFSDRWTGLLKMHNIADIDYNGPSTGASKEGIPERGREFWVSLEYQFD